MKCLAMKGSSVIFSLEIQNSNIFTDTENFVTFTGFCVGTILPPVYSQGKVRNGPISQSSRMDYVI